MTIEITIAHQGYYYDDCYDYYDDKFGSHLRRSAGFQKSLLPPKQSTMQQTNGF